MSFQTYRKSDFCLRSFYLMKLELSYTPTPYIFIRLLLHWVHTWLLNCWSWRKYESDAFVNCFLFFGDYHVPCCYSCLCILQCLLRLKEPAVLLRCRKDDIVLLESVLSSAKEEYAKKANVHQPEIIVDDVHLPPSPSTHGPSWYICTVYLPTEHDCSIVILHFLLSYYVTYVTVFFWHNLAFQNSKNSLQCFFSGWYF